MVCGGEGGIRTPDTLASMPHFECGAFDHSATSPRSGRHPSRCGLSLSGENRGWQSLQCATPTQALWPRRADDISATREIDEPDIWLSWIRSHELKHADVEGQIIL